MHMRRIILSQFLWSKLCNIKFLAQKIVTRIFCFGHFNLLRNCYRCSTNISSLDPIHAYVTYILFFPSETFVFIFFFPSAGGGLLKTFTSLRRSSRYYFFQNSEQFYNGVPLAYNLILYSNF